MFDIAAIIFLRRLFRYFIVDISYSSPCCRLLFDAARYIISISLIDYAMLCCYLPLLMPDIAAFRFH